MTAAPGHFTEQQALDWLARNQPRPAIRKCADAWKWHKSSVHRFLVKNNILPISPTTLNGSDTSRNFSAEEQFLVLLRERNSVGKWVTPLPGKGYAPKELAAMPGAQGFPSSVFAKAMRQLIADRRIGIDISGPPSRRQRRLILTSSDHVGEQLINMSHPEFVELLKARHQRKQELFLAAKAEVVAAEKLLMDLGRKLNGHL